MLWMLLVDSKIAGQFLNELQPLFVKSEVEIFADTKAAKLLKGYPYLHKATNEDFGREFLSLKCAVKVVENIDEALTHIQRYSTKHSEAIISENKRQCERFLQEVDAATVYMNASTRFTDGEVFAGCRNRYIYTKTSCKRSLCIGEACYRKMDLEG